MTDTQQPPDTLSLPIEDFDLYAPRPLPELHGLFREFRSACPVGRSEQNGGFWFVTTYEDVHSIARDPATFSNERGIVVPPIGGERVIPNDYDPPEHGQYRTLLQSWLSPGNVKRFEPRVREMARGYLSRLESPCDVVGEFVFPYALEVVTTVVGVPQVMRSVLVDFVRTLLGEGGEDYTKAAEAMGEFSGFVQEVLIDPRRAEGPTDDPDDVVDLLVGSTMDGRGLTDAEIRQTVMAVLGAGFETSYKTLASCLWYLAEHREAWDAMCSGADAFASGFEELLRFSAPASVGRTAMQDVTVAGQEIKAGDSVLLCLPAANRDRAEFPDPDSLLMTRHPNRHLTFGVGIHRCIGMHVARLELTVALQEVMAMFDEISIPAGQAPVCTGSQAAGIIKLPLAFTRATDGTGGRP